MKIVLEEIGEELFIETPSRTFTIRFFKNGYGRDDLEVNGN